MAYHFTGSSSEYVEIERNVLDPVLTDSEKTPLYVTAMVRLTETLAGGRTAFYFGNGSSNTQYIIMYVQADGTVRVHDRTGGRETAATSGSLNDFEWHHISFLLVDEGTNHVVYCWLDDEAAKTATNSGPANFQVYTQVSIGALRRSGPTGYITADIAEVAMVGVRPTFADRAQLRAGWSVDSVFPGSKIHGYWTLDEQTDIAVANVARDHSARNGRWHLPDVGGTPNRVVGPHGGRIIRPLRNNVGTSIAVLGAAPPATRNRVHVA